MRYWWVNQNQTYRHEVPGDYLWSPKRNANGNRNPFYDFMREVAPGDVVFSFADTFIKAIGIVVSNAYEAPKPLEFGQAGAYWDKIGWRVDVNFVELRLPIRPSEHMSVLGPHLPDLYSPLQRDVLVSPVAHKDSLTRLGLDPERKINVGRFSSGQKNYLEYHRDSVLLRSTFLESR